MKKVKLYYLLSSFFLIFLINTAQAEFIWLVKPPGIENDPLAENGIINYQAPLWEGDLLPDYENPDFPSFLYTPCDEKNKAQEIRIDFHYLQDYNNPILKIRVIKPEVIDSNNPYYLKVYKELFGGEVWSQEKIDQKVASRTYEFPLGYIKKGNHEKNRIVIRIDGPSYTRIKFDILYLYFDADDSDGDGISDVDEGEAYRGNNSIAGIPIKSYDPSPLNPQRLILYIEELTPSFREVKFLDPNSAKLPDWLQFDLFLPFEILGFKVVEIAPHEHINITFRYTDTLYSSVRFYTYQDSNVWQETAHELLDRNTARITLTDGGAGDFDGEKDGIISTRLTLAYPKELNIHVPKGGCFIGGILWGKEK